VAGNQPAGYPRLLVTYAGHHEGHREMKIISAQEKEDESEHQELARYTNLFKYLIVNMSGVFLYTVCVYCPCNYLFIFGFINLFLRLWVSTLGYSSWERGRGPT
jgi:hypothetical protein